MRLAIVSPQFEGRTESGIPYGAESGYGYNDLPQFVRSFYALPAAIFEINDYVARYYSILRIGMECNITNVTTLNPKIFSILFQKIPEWQDRIIGDIAAGTLNKGFKIEGMIRKKIERNLRPNPARAEALKSILKDKGELLPKYFWPDMEIIECWKSGMMALYIDELARYFGNVPIRDIGCVSTETRSSVPISDEGGGGALAIETNFYEFLPKEDAGKKNMRILLCGELEKSKEYFLIVTTPGGLFRYNIDDIIKVTGFFNRTPIIEFVQKGLSAASIAGEKLYEEQLNGAVKAALERSGLTVEFFSAVALAQGMPHYAFLAEFSGNPSEEEKRKFLKIMEEELCRHNREYEFVRQAKLLGAPVLKVVRRGDFEIYRMKRISQGAHDTQLKIVELTNDAGFLKNFNIEEELRP